MPATDAAARTLGGRICHLGLLYPSLYEDTPSCRSPELRYLLPRGMRQFYTQSYLGEDERAVHTWGRASASPPACPVSG